MKMFVSFWTTQVHKGWMRPVKRFHAIRLSFLGLHSQRAPYFWKVGRMPSHDVLIKDKQISSQLSNILFSPCNKESVFPREQQALIPGDLNSKIFLCNAPLYQCDQILPLLNCLWIKLHFTVVSSTINNTKYTCPRRPNSVQF